jgi:hypothetical protein
MQLAATPMMGLSLLRRVLMNRIVSVASVVLIICGAVFLNDRFAIVQSVGDAVGE